MKNPGEQWVEEIDGVKHMLKLVPRIDGCRACFYYGEWDECVAYPNAQCNREAIIKDLGIVNEDGLLPCPFCGDYPTVAPYEYGGWTVFCDGNSHSTRFGSFFTKQETIDEANRRV